MQSVEIINASTFRSLYKFSSQIGSGKYGRVFKATFDQEKVSKACKIVKKEGDYLRELNHLVELKDCLGVLPLQRVVFSRNEMLMQFPLGVSLDSILEHRKKEQHCVFDHLTFCLRMTLYLLRSISDIHRRNIIHRDLKPENIVLLPKNDRPFIIDFGFSKVSIADEKSAFSFYKITTPSYRAPELFKTSKTQEYDNLIDEWSVGVILFEMFTGSLPFAGDNSKEISKSILKYVKWKEGLAPQYSHTDVLHRMEKSYFKMVRKEIERSKTVFKQEDCDMCKIVLLKIATMLLDTNPSKRLHAEKILSMVEYRLPRYEPLALKNCKPIKLSKSTLDLLSHTIFKYFLACDQAKCFYTVVYYHALAMWFHLMNLETIVWEDKGKLLLSCSILATAYDGCNDEEQNIVTSEISKNDSLASLNGLCFDVLEMMGARLWMMPIVNGYNEKWNSERERENTIKIFEQYLLQQ